MKESVFDVLMYLFNNYLDDEYELDADQESLQGILTHAGFEEVQVKKAFDWLESLTFEDILQTGNKPQNNISHRIFNSYEMEKLSIECRGLLTYLEHTGILDSQNREIVIDRVMALESDEIDVYQLKWVVLMVLMNQPGKEDAFSWMEEIVMNETELGLH
ncbi:MAG: DUF494 domain-containing protein [Gammaproteobacteria bacterium]|nr:DUF494 domain-containing protein [Gammaproteobacteria bacterium]